jgi:hypothetical protein
MTEHPEHKSWFTGEPKVRGRYLVIDVAFWHERCATWVPGNGNTKSRWYPDGGQYCDADAIAMFRPLPAIPPRDPPKTRDDSRTIVKD